MTTALAIGEKRRARREAKAANTRRLNINLPARTFEELERLAAESGRSLTEMIRIAIALVQVAVDEESHGRKLAVIDQDERIMKVIVALR